jgi:hypothetical protein
MKIFIDEWQSLLCRRLPSSSDAPFVRRRLGSAGSLPKDYMKTELGSRLVSFHHTRHKAGKTEDPIEKTRDELGLALNQQAN